MKIFLDTCEIETIKNLAQIGIVDGVTTNPSIIAKSGKDFEKTIHSICQIVETSVSVEVIAEDYDGMVQEANKLSKIGEQITIKLPITFEGLKACKTLAASNIPVNMTLCFSATQALLAAKAGASYVSPFVGRLDDIGQSGLNLISEICAMYENYPDIGTQIIVASVRNNDHIIQSAKLGADIIALPPKFVAKNDISPFNRKRA